MTDQSGVSDDPTMRYRHFWYSKTGMSVYTTPELDAMIDRLGVSVNQKERLDYHYRIQSKIMEQIPMVVICHRNNVVIMKKNIEGYRCSTSDWQYFRGIADAEKKK